MFNSRINYVIKYLPTLLYSTIPAEYWGSYTGFILDNYLDNLGIHSGLQVIRFKLVNNYITCDFGYFQDLRQWIEVVSQGFIDL